MANRVCLEEGRRNGDSSPLRLLCGGFDIMGMVFNAFFAQLPFYCPLEQSGDLSLQQVNFRALYNQHAFLYVNAENCRVFLESGYSACL